MWMVKTLAKRRWNLVDLAGAVWCLDLLANKHYFLLLLCFTAFVVISVVIENIAMVKPDA